MILRKTFDKYYGNIQVGVLIVNALYSKVVYHNAAYATFFDLPKSGILKSDHHKVLFKAWKKNRNKTLGTLRIVPDESNGKILLLDAFNNEMFVSGKRYHVLVLVPNKNRDRMHKTIIRESYIFDDLRVSIPNQLVKVRSKTVNFSATEFKLFAFLCSKEDQLFSKDELLKQVWGKLAQNTRTVDIYISRIKKRLKAAGSKKDYIKTMHGRGYLFQIIT